MIRLIVLLLACVTACSNETVCTARGSLQGVHVNVDKAVAGRAESLAMEVCWDGACQEASTELMPSTVAGNQTCSGEVCSAEAVRTGGKFGFASITGLPKRPVEVRLTLRGADPAPVPARTIKVTPKATFPNGPDCGEGGPQAVLTIAADGSVREG